MMEKIELPQEYIELIKTCRNTPFIMIDVSKEKIEDFEKFADINKNVSKIRISEAVKVEYFGNGQINVFYDYNEEPETFNVIKDSMFFL